MHQPAWLWWRGVQMLPRALPPLLLLWCCQVLLLEDELAAIKDEDRQRTRLLGDMAAQRDR